MTGARLGLASAIGVGPPLLGSEARGVRQFRFGPRCFQQGHHIMAATVVLTNPQLAELSEAHAGYANGDGLPGGGAKICSAQLGQRPFANSFKISNLHISWGKICLARPGQRCSANATKFQTYISTRGKISSSGEGQITGSDASQLY
jgi:hypothetical protein